MGTNIFSLTADEGIGSGFQNVVLENTEDCGQYPK
jgi:hypothetical protein